MGYSLGVKLFQPSFELLDWSWLLTETCSCWYDRAGRNGPANATKPGHLSQKTQVARLA